MNRLPRRAYNLGMELRRHPFVRFYGMPSWPPVWSNTDGKVVRGELGILKDCTHASRLNNICFLLIEHEGETYTGALLLDDESFCRRLFAILKEHIGKPIREIGALDLLYSLLASFWQLGSAAA